MKLATWRPVCLALGLTVAAAGLARAQGFQSVYSRDGTDVMAVGDNGQTYRSLDGGSSWSLLVLGSNLLTLRDVTGRGVTYLVVGDQGYIWKSVDAGGNWSATIAPSSPNLRAAAMVTDQVWVVAGGGGTILRSIDAGANWNPVTSGTSLTLNSLKFTDALNGWAAGDGGTLLQTADGGASWTPVTIGTVQALLSVDQRGSQVWVVGANGTAWRSANGGASFAAVNLKLDAHADVNDVTMVSPDTVYIAGGGGFIRNSIDAGGSWKFQLHSMHAPITRIATFGTYAWATNSRNRVILWSSNRGVTWNFPIGAALSRNWGAAPKYPNSLQVRGSGFAINPVNKAIYCGIGDRVVRSRDDGNTWQTAAMFPINYNKCNAFIISTKDSSKWLAALSGSAVSDHLFRTTDGGANWTPVMTRDFGEYGIPIAMDPDRPDTVWFGGESNANGSPQTPLYRSVDFGATWDSIATTSFRSPCDIIVVPDTTGIVLVGDGVTGVGQGKYWKSIDGGLNFTLQSTRSSSEIPGMATSRLRPYTIFGTNWSSGGVQRSGDYGTTWPTVDNTAQAWGIDIAKDDPNVVVFGQYSLNFDTRLSVDGGTSFVTIPDTTGFNNNYSFYLRDRATILAEQSSGIWKLQNIYTYTPIQVSPSVQLTSPDDGDAWDAGSVHDITWNATGVPVVDVEYRRTPSDPWQLVAEVGGYVGHVAWHVPWDVTTTANIRVTSLLDGSITSQLASGFTILTPVASVTPGSLDFGTHGTGSSTVLPLTIHNTGSGPLNVTSISPTTGVYVAGRTTLTIAPAGQDTVGIWFLPTSAGTFPDTVTITSNDSINTPVRVPLTGEAVGPTLAVVAPNGGESWVGGATHDITWSSTFVSTVDLAYRVAPDSGWVSIASGLPALPASYAWSVPYAPTSTAAMRITGNGGTPTDLSDAEFTILASRLATSPDTVRIGVVQVGHTLWDPLWLNNTGNVAATVGSIAVSNPKFWVGRSSVVVAGGEMDTVGVFYHATDTSADTATITISYDAPGSPRVAIAVARGITSLAVTDPRGPAAFALGQNQPNPFARATLIAYTLPRESDVTLEVFDLRGERVATLVDGRQSAGRHEASFGAGAHQASGHAIPAGVYFYRLHAGSLSATRKMLLVN